MDDKVPERVAENVLVAERDADVDAERDTVGTVVADPDVLPEGLQRWGPGQQKTTLGTGSVADLGPSERVVTAGGTTD